MASPSSSVKLKQSSLHFYLLRPKATSASSPVAKPASTVSNTTASEDVNHTTEDPDLTDTAEASLPATSSGPAVSDYERARQENISRNEAFLRKLGISTILQSTKAAAPSKRAPRPKPRDADSSPAHTAPLRRSTRKRRLPDDPPEAGDIEEALPPPVPTYIDSSVFQYACSASKDSAFNAPQSLSPCSPTESCFSGFRIAGGPLVEQSLAKVYAMDVSPVKGSGGRVLVAAGGHGGVVAVFGVDRDEADYGADTGLDDEPKGPLMTWKASGSWISGVAFLRNNPSLLLSSSNDGRVVVWDISKQVLPLPSSSSYSPPRVVAESRGLHSGGIFNMDMYGSIVATASKDSSLGISRVLEGGELIVDRSISGHHAGVIRGVSFGDTKDKLADCGADARICVLDTRLPESCSLTIESKHSTGVNTVEWCPSNSFILMSASKDPTLLLYDIRNPTESLHELHGHTEDARCYQIYRPTFLDGGVTIATPGPGSKKITTYSWETGKLLSQGFIGYDANLVLCTAGTADFPDRLWTARKQINQLSLILLS